ncbi:substrate-binding domain-containing protein [Peptococcaceae bacterium 1198_IL3148]
MPNSSCRRPASCPAGFKCLYTVVAGDTMYCIARRFGITLERLILANPHITNPELIYPGDKLCVPSKIEPKEELVLATTTSTVDTGLLDVLIPMFERQTGCNVIVYAVGSGSALAMGARGEADVVLSHSPDLEQRYVEQGYFTNYRLVMYNDFIIAGPAEDPANIRGMQRAPGALAQIAASEATFVSRGDYSGTHLRELELWERAGVVPGGDWYRLANAGMAETLNMAIDLGAYTLSDRGTYLAQRKDIEYAIMVEGDPLLLNFYHVMQVNPRRFPTVNAQCAAAFVQFMINPRTQRIIGEYGIDRFGEPLFIPAAGKSMEDIMG